jgi:intraflagellar transport protein 56
MQEYEGLTNNESCHPDVWINLACCYFMLGMYDEAKAAIDKGPKTSLIYNRLSFHLAEKSGDHEVLMTHHQNLQNVAEDQLSLAAMNYLRTHYHAAIDIYKRLLQENRDMLALNVYSAMCYHKLDYYDISQEMLASYVQMFPSSVMATNLKACNNYRLYGGKAAEAELKHLTDQLSPNFVFGQDIIQHNLVIFRNGEGALQVFPNLIGIIPEAKLNLAIYYLRHDNADEGYALLKDMSPTAPLEYIMKAVALTLIGQEHNSPEHLKLAQQYFQLVGSSASECDTIPGRQCMSSYLFLRGEYENALVYLNSIKGFFFNDDTFNFNFGQAKALMGMYSEAQEMFLQINSDQIKSSYLYISWLARCYIMNRKPEKAWELYIKMDTSAESFNLLQLIANDCYRMGHFVYAAQAFDLLERLDPQPEYWHGKRGACIGVFQQVIAGHEPQVILSEVVQLLQRSQQPQAEHILKVITKWARDLRP